MATPSVSNKEIHNNVVPRKVPQEMITPYKLTVAVLIKCYCQFRVSDDMECLPGIEQVNIRKAFCIFSLKILQGPDLGLIELKRIQNTFPALTGCFNEMFDENLNDLYKSGIGSLLNVIDDLKLVLDGESSQNSSQPVKNVIAKNSVIGHFLRRFIIFFQKLSFSAVSTLYQNFGRYYNAWLKSVHSSMMSVELDIDHWYLGEKQWSRRQAELFLATQAALLHNDQEKALPPQALQNRISSILKSNPDLAEAHFLSYLNYLQVEEFCSSMQCLFHCFDRRSNPDVKYYSDEKFSKEHRYAALNLAILYHHFGHMKEALASLKEAIKTAHEANDNLCLQHALSWLYRLSNVNKDNLIVQCIIKTFELNMNYTTSLALQNFARYGSAKTSVKPSVIFETLTKSDMLNCQHNYKDLIFNNGIMKSSLWRLYGKTDMCSLWAQVLLYLNIDTVTQTAAYYGEGYLQAVCSLAFNLLMQGEYNLVNVVLQYAKEKYPHEPVAHNWMLVENWATYVRAFYQEKYQEAESAAQKILVFDKWEGYLKLAQLYFYQQEYQQAEKCVGFIMQNYNYDEQLNDGKFCLLRAKILQAEIQFASGYSNVSGTVFNLNNCLIEAEKSELAYEIALVQLLMANVLLSLGLTTQALKLLNNPHCMIEMLANGGIYDKSRATLLYVKCLIADSSKLDEIRRREVLINAVKSLEKVKNGFLKVEAFSRAKDVLYLQSYLYNTVNLRNERNICAMEYRLMDEEHPSRNIQTLINYL